MAGLDLLLVGEEPNETAKKVENLGLDELHICRYAYEKAFRYAKLVIERKGGDVEVGGFLTAPKGSEDRVARDAFLARDQRVRSGFYKLHPEDVAKAAKELKDNGQKILGWWHSHGRFPTGHSQTDIENQIVLLNAISPSNYVTIQRENTYAGLQSKVEGNCLIFWDPKNPATEFNIELKGNNPELEARKLQILEKKKIGFTYSFVVNWSRWISMRTPYCEIATSDLCRTCRNAEDVSDKVGFKLFEEGEYKIDNMQLVQEIDERVHLFDEGYKKKEYLLPPAFEEKRAAGTLSKPDFGPELHQTKYPSATDSIVEFLIPSPRKVKYLKPTPKPKFGNNPGGIGK